MVLDDQSQGKSKGRIPSMVVKGSGSQSVVTRPAASVSFISENLLAPSKAY